MSEENVEIVRAAIEATIRRPRPDWETMNTLFHPDHEFLGRDAGLEGGGGHRGAEGYREWLTSMSETMEWEQQTLAEVTEIDHERVMAVIPTKFRGRQSGAETEQRIAAVVTVRGGQVVRTELFQSPEQALEAAGLRE
jgi:ketosteroid isomerase-like protein